MITVVCRPPVYEHRLTCLGRMRTLGAVKPCQGHRPGIQGFNFPVTRLGGGKKALASQVLFSTEFFDFNI